MRGTSGSGAEPATVVSPCVTLDGFGAAVARSRGLALGQLGPLDVLTVQTRNTLYRIVVPRPPDPEILVQGGVFFPHRTRARLAGSSLGGSLLKVSWIGAGFRMEFYYAGQRIITSPVRSVEVEGDAVPGPF
jgi:hypothetical protein